MSEAEGQESRTGATGTRTGRPSFTETHRRAVRLEIARAAVDLFTLQGVERTSAAEIADAAGISLRTLWRYVPSKEETITQLFTLAAEGLAARLRDWPRDVALADFLTGGSWHPELDANTRALLREASRLTRAEPALRTVSMQAAFAFQSHIAAAFAERAGLPEPDLETNVHAATLLATLAVADQEYAWHHEGPDDESVRRALTARALRAAARGLP